METQQRNAFMKLEKFRSLLDVRSNSSSLAGEFQSREISVSPFHSQSQRIENTMHGDYLTFIRQMSKVFLIYFLSNNSKLVCFQNLRIGFSDTFVMSLESLSMDSTSSTSFVTPYSDLPSGLFMRWIVCKIFSVSASLPWLSPWKRKTGIYETLYSIETKNSQQKYKLEIFTPLKRWTWDSREEKPKWQRR